MGDVFCTEVSRRAKDELEASSTIVHYKGTRWTVTTADESRAGVRKGCQTRAGPVEDENAEDGAEALGRMAQGLDDAVS